MIDYHGCPFVADTINVNYPFYKFENYNVYNIFDLKFLQVFLLGGF